MLAPAPAPTPSPLARPPRFAALGGAFFTPLAPIGLPRPYWVAHSAALARELGLSDAWMSSAEALAVFSGNAPLGESAPLTSVYSGHQFGVWAGQLGDGRAHLIGELLAPDGSAHEVQLKGSGLTPYSRMGDGRAVLRSSIREFLASEAMHALGVPTTRALALVGSDLPVYREEVESAAIVTRVAPSFVRFGHFEHFAARNDLVALGQLADFVIDHFYPACRDDPAFGGQAPAALLAAITRRTAALVAHWQAIGFCHGVMNTDNMSALGQTIDYGPYQFLDGFDPGHICNHSDTRGRYAFDQQPSVAYWNLFCLAQALLPLIGDEQLALRAVEGFRPAYARAMQQHMAAKLGLAGTGGQESAAKSPEIPESHTENVPQADLALAEDALRLLASERVDHTIFWRRLSHHVARLAELPAPPEQAAPTTGAVRDLFAHPSALEDWLLRYEQRLAPDARAPAARLMRQTNPAVVLRNHLCEQAIAAAKQHDFGPVQRLLTVLSTPFDENLETRPEAHAYLDFAPAWAASIQISCSS